MSAICLQCQTSNSSQARFCQNCGAVLAATSVQNRTVALASAPTVPGRSAFNPQTIQQQYFQASCRPQISSPGRITTVIDQREHVIEVLDRSWSMKEFYRDGITKLEAAIRAAITAICTREQIDPQDEIGLVIFNSQADILFDLHPICTHKRQMIQAIQSLQPDNGTDINQGLKKARDLFDWNRQDVIRRIQLLTDGHGGRPVRTAQNLKDQGVILEVTGIGESPGEVNEKLLKKIASVIGGELQYQFITDPKTLVTRYTQLGRKTMIG